MKKVLILTSIKTGSGHKSSANAIEKKLTDFGYACKQLDVFPLMGFMGDLMENSYITLTTRAPLIYYICERFSQAFPDLVHLSMYLRIKDAMLKEIREYQPDLIISVQCMFTKAISRLLARNRIDIPFYVGVIDLVEPPNVWKDPDADMSFVPTETVRQDYLNSGFPEDRVLTSGFPVRDDIVVRDKAKQINNRVHILMVNTSTNLEKNIRFLKEVSRLEKVSIKFICGLDKRLYETLTKMKENGEIPEDVDIYSFVDNMNEFLTNAHIILTKAGPNVISEAVRSDTAVVITGHIKGQENKNYQFITDNGYGFKCEDPDLIYGRLFDFIYTPKLKVCLDTIVRHKISNGAEYIAEYVKDHI
ncbi:MAG: hypothetical protein K5908_04075 [Erysipelotrichaceae bacterium]|jgi:UDP-N-acetylglucosamine:LPS N-acetylglucosamine transferase|nr:hypothetical protein [Erysipelotrichaceae bacterium]